MSRYSEMLDFTGKCVIVTGALSGAGRDIAGAFIESGADVILTYNRSGSAADEFKKQWPGRNMRFMQLDQSSNASIDAFAAALKADGVKVDCLVNNAGIYPSKDITQITEAEWDAMMDTNAKGVFFLTKAVIPLMEKGTVINVSSINATNPSRWIAHYGMSKAAVEMMTRAEAASYGSNIRVNCIAPGLIYKEGQDEYIPGWSDSYKERSPLHRLVTAEELGRICLFLASDLSSVITGQIITADCGIMLSPCFYNSL